MEKIREWWINKVANWLFSPPSSKKKKTFTEISGWDDYECFYAGEYEITWEKGKKVA